MIRITQKLRLFFILFLLLFSCSSKTGEVNIPFSMQNASITAEEAFEEGMKEGWYAPKGNVKEDITNTYEDQSSLFIEQQASENSVIYHFLHAKDYSGTSITFSGKYKYADVENGEINCYIEQIYGLGSTKRDSIVIDKLVGNGEWQDFEIKVPLEDPKFFVIVGLQMAGKGKVWTSNWNLKTEGIVAKQTYKADKDTEFDQGSNIHLSTLTPQMTENLEVLGKVWGFLKYYHPEVTQGNYNWDYELFRVITPIANAKDKAERNMLISKWIDKYGKSFDKEEYVIADSTKYSRIIKLNWLKDKNLFDEALINKLQSIKTAKRDSKFNYYVIPPLRTSFNPFEREKAYENISWEDQGFRIITLFRLWNAMEYNFPYLELTDTSWNNVLREYIPQFIEPKDKANYHTAIRKMAALLDDSHIGINTKDADFEATPIARINYNNSFSVSLMQSKEGDIVVSSTMAGMLTRGDILTAIEGRDVKEIIDEMKPYFAASNEPTKMSRILPNLLKSKTKELPISIVRDGKKMDVLLQPFTENKDPQRMKKWADYKTKNPKIAYLDVSSDEATLKEFIAEMDGTEGIILDMRKYPNMGVMQAMENILYKKKNPFVWFSSNEATQAGSYKFSFEGTTSDENPNYYKGKVAIIVNEGTQSHGEFSSMSYRTASQSTIIGSQTAGADGNIAIMSLPGNMQMSFTALGTYYPNWELCQRTGIKIDIPVRPSNKDIKEGKDALIEKAIEYINK